MKRVTPASSPPIPHLVLNVLSKGSDDSLIAKGSIQNKPCHVIIDTGRLEPSPGLTSSQSAREEAESAVRFADGVRGDHLRLEGDADRAESDEERFEDVGFGRRDHG